MGCFLGCFGGEKNRNRSKSRAKRTTPQVQRSRVQDVHDETVGTAEETTADTMVAECRNEHLEEGKPNPIIRKKVAFSPNVTTYEHENNEEFEVENHCHLKRMSSLLEPNSSDVSNVGSFPPNHRYYNARESDDEADVYGDIDLDNLDEDDYGDCNDYESVLASSTESKREICAINKEVESVIALKIQPHKDRSDHRDYVVNSIESVSQSKAVEASLSNWLDSAEKTMLKRTSSSGLDDCALNIFEDRPILGALTVDELRRISAASTPRKSPSQSPEEIPIIGTVGTFWNHSASSTRDDSASPCRGRPNTTSKNIEDAGVETRLDGALDCGAYEA